MQLRQNNNPTIKWREQMNRKLDRDAISAVIGVILMVAIAVSMAAVAYAYFTGMIGGGNVITPVIDFLPSETANSITVTAADVDVFWNDINITFTNETGIDYLEKTGRISAGDTIYLDTQQSLTGTVTVTFRHIPSNSMISDGFKFFDVN
jgi:FlaG/FlaF family flagellin (archaellin)